MEWQQLLGFYHVARLGSFTRAAAVTFRSQSALSQQVKSLEEELATLLVERIGRRQLRLTAAGEKLFTFAAGMLSNYEQLKEELGELKGLSQGDLRIAAPFTTLYHLISRVLAIYVRRFPEVRLTILDRSQPEVIELVKNGDVDLGFAAASLVPRDLLARRWLQVEPALMVPVGHPLALAKRVTLRQIARYPLILPPASGKESGRRRLEDLLQQQGLAYRVIMESSNVELSSLYVEMGLGISFATLVGGLNLLPARRISFLPLKRYFKEDYLAVVRRPDKVLSSYKEAFLEGLLEHFPVSTENEGEK